MQEALPVSHVADHESLRGGLAFHQGRYGENLVAAHATGLLVHIDDLEVVAALQMPFADVAHAGDRARGTGREPGHVESQHVLVGRDHALARRGRRSRPTSTRSVLERSPMIFLIGVGSLRTRVGSARIWSPRPSAGFSTRSMTSML